MVTTHDLAQALFPGVTRTPADLEALYPPRALPEGAQVTRIAPSPTGYLHLGVLYAAAVNRWVARQSGGVFYFRLEDTDQKREVAGGADDLLAGLNAYGVRPDEGFVAPGEQQGVYGPYQQRQRVDLYHVYVKDLVARGLAYPCFCGEEARQAARQQQEQQGLRGGYYGRFAVCRTLTPEQALQRVQAGESYVVRLCSPGSENKRIAYDDRIRGKIELPENDEDIVLLKSDGVPTYHFAHVVDDHLMRTTLVIRGDEWISSVPKHLQLFSVLGFKPPRYAHISPLLKEENGCKRKLSKRKDPEAAVKFFREQGFPADAVMEYLLTVANSDYEEWRRANPAAPRDAFKFQLKKMSVAGALFDLNKLRDVSKTVIAAMDADTVFTEVAAWAAAYAPEFAARLACDPAYARGLFAIDRGGPKPRKDLATWGDAPGYAAYFFDDTFTRDDRLPEHLAPADAAAICRAYVNAYDPALEQADWFAALKALCPDLGFCPEVKEYKKHPDEYKGHVGDVSTVLRLAVTGRRNTPDLCAILHLLGVERVHTRLQAAAALWEQAAAILTKGLRNL